MIHVTTTGTIQPAYYYMRTRYGVTGMSISSDTLKSIFLNIFTNDVLKLTYNDVHQPKLPSTAGSFTVQKEYPLGNWYNLAITPEATWYDTLTLCTPQKMNFQVFLPDNSGCISVSNVQGGDYSDHKQPAKVQVDSISVLPNGNTVLTWFVPGDKDVKEYEIQHRVGTTNVPVDLVNGRNTTFYIFNNTNATTNTVGLFVKAIDSCAIGSISVDYDVRTMYLKASYDRCAYQSYLEWSPYDWPKRNDLVIDETLEYRVFYSVNGGAFTKIGSTTSTTFTHSKVDPASNVSYYVRAINLNGNRTSSSNRASFFTDQVPTASFVYIKSASVLGKKSNKIRLLLDTSETSQGIEVYRAKDSTSEFSLVGFVPFDGTMHYELVDEKVESNINCYTYRAIVRDACGNARTVSNRATTMLLKVNEDQQDLFTKHLSWSPYKGFDGGTAGYNILRIVNDNYNTSPIGSTDALTFTFTDNIETAAPEGSKIDYVVEAVEGITNTYGLFEQSNSNSVPVYMEGRLFVPNAFAPSGVNRTWKPITHFIDKTDYRVTVYNRWGNVVFDTLDDTEAWDGSGCSAGAYVYLINYKVSRGEYKQLKGTVQLIR